MNVVGTNYTIAEYCQQLERNEIQVNRKYQRSDKVWPAAARSFLIETILLGYPVPKLSLYQKIDLKSRQALKEIVDGQQRSSAILDFYKDKFRLSKKLETEDIAGECYSSLPDDYKSRFLNYGLAADLFVGANPETIREVFRRINSYTVPLNPEENRHATYQGAFKWFVYRLSRKCNTILDRLGVFGEKQFVRMADTKLYAEVIHALLNGITTTKKSELDNLYKRFEENFESEEEFGGRIFDALRYLDEWAELHDGALMKPHLVYAFILALTHVLHPVGTLIELFGNGQSQGINDQAAKIQLSKLADALDNPEAHKDDEFHTFILASTSKTNVAAQRITRFQWFCSALTDGNRTN